MVHPNQRTVSVHMGDKSPRKKNKEKRLTTKEKQKRKKEKKKARNAPSEPVKIPSASR